MLNYPASTKENSEKSVMAASSQAQFWIQDLSILKHKC